VIFEDGEREQLFTIHLVDKGMWNATKEFKLFLSNPDNCELGKYLYTARVKIIDKHTFPSDKYAARLNEGPDEYRRISSSKLFLEYFKLNFHQPDMFSGTILTLCCDQLPNLNLILQTWMSMYMVDVVFNIKDKETEKELVFFQTRLKEAFLVAVLWVVPIFFLHLWSYVKIRLDLEGHAVAYLRANLMRKYLNLSEAAREELDSGHVQVAMTNSCVKLASGYVAVVDCVRSVGTVLVLIIFTLHSNPDAWWVAVAMPLIMVAYVIFRACLPDVQRAGKQRRRLFTLVDEICKNYRLILAYYQREKMNERLSDRVAELRQQSLPEAIVTNNNEYFPTYLGKMFIGLFIVISAPVVLGEKEGHHGPLSLGTFLATIAVIKEVAATCLLMYKDYLVLVRTSDAVKDSHIGSI
jgi:ABC-type multidrug transport system fused ATPase/permease subunit